MKPAKGEQSKLEVWRSIERLGSGALRSHFRTSKKMQQQVGYGSLCVHLCNMIPESQNQALVFTNPCTEAAPARTSCIHGDCEGGEQAFSSTRRQQH